MWVKEEELDLMSYYVPNSNDMSLTLVLTVTMRCRFYSEAERGLRVLGDMGLDAEISLFLFLILISQGSNSLLVD